MEAGKRRLAGDTVRAANNEEVEASKNHIFCCVI